MPSGAKEGHKRAKYRVISRPLGRGPARPATPRRLRLATRLSAVIALAATLVGLLSGGLALFDWVAKEVHRPAPPAPANIDARILRVHLRDARESLADYLKETGQRGAAMSAFQLAETGYVFVVRVRLQGNEAKRLPLRWSMLDSDGRRLAGPTYNQTAVVFVPRAANHARTWPIWVPYPPTHGTFRVRVTLVDEHGRPLDEADSRRFTLKKPPPP